MIKNFSWLQHFFYLARIIHQAPMHRGHGQGKVKIMRKMYLDTLRK